MTEEIVERIELKIAYLERANLELSDVVYRQQRELAALTARLSAALDRIEALQQPQRQYTQEEEKPPHY